MPLEAPAFELEEPKCDMHGIHQGDSIDVKNIIQKAKAHKRAARSLDMNNT